jgi:aspartate/methionine/tyrosine aminotransferase
MEKNMMSRFSPNEIISLIGVVPRFDLGGSYGPNLALEELLDDDTEARIKRIVLGYGTAQGDAELRAAIGGVQGVRADDVVITVGGAHALFLLAFTLCDRGDEAVVVTPVFPPARAALDAVGATVRELTVSFDGGYQLDPDALRPLLSKKTKLVSVASPQNPSGVAIPIDRLRAMVELMAQLAPQAFLVVDDTYREASFGDEPIAASALSLGPKVVTVASFSKCHGAPGLRLGWAITRDASLREALVIGKFNTVVSSPPIEEALALRVLQLRDRILGERRTLLAQCLATTQAWMDANASLVQWVRPDAGAICCVRLRPDVYDEAAVVRFYDALSQAGVRVSKGVWFADEPRVFRLGFGHLALPQLEAAYVALGAALMQATGAVA